MQATPKVNLSISLMLSAAAVFLAPALKADTTFNFQTINNPTNLTFNQLLGINNSGVIAGYYGDGTVNPNKGYTVTPPYNSGSFTPENFPGSAQTQVTGLNNGTTTVGFWVDGAGNNLGFVKQGSNFATVTPASAPTFNQLLGVNDSNIAVGFYQDSSNNFHGYTYNIATKTFTAVTPTGAVSTTATGINNSGWISGFFVDAMGNQHGFIDENGNFITADDPNGSNTSLFGINNKGEAVGTYTANGITQGAIYNITTGTWQTVDDPHQSSTAAFNFSGSALNGINDLGQVVGFYSDGTNVDGFLATPTPEPASFALAGLGAALVLLARKKLHKS